VSYVDAVDDVATIVITQSATERSLYVSSRRFEEIVSDTKPFTPIGAFTSIAFHQ